LPFGGAGMAEPTNFRALIAMIVETIANNRTAGRRGSKRTGACR
jgi:hypothetical protein